MASMEELEARVTALEEKVQHIGQDAAAARVLAGAADRDVAAFGAKLDAHTKLLGALRETQIEHGQRLDSLEQKVRSGFSEMREGFTKLAIGQAEITALLKRQVGREPDGE
jgi:hypothetical protein